jgi:hypothetical protein
MRRVFVSAVRVHGLLADVDQQSAVDVEEENAARTHPHPVVHGG